MYIHYVALNSTHDSNFVVDRPNGRIDFLFLLIKTPSNFIIENTSYTVTAPSVLLLDSNTPHRYFPTSTEYIDDYLHFAVEDRLSFLKELTFPLNYPFQISNNNYIHDILTLIYNEFNLESRNSKQIFTLLIQLLMLKVGDEWSLYQHHNEYIPHYTDLLEIRNLILNSPGKSWTIDELAEQAHLSHAYFQVLYKKAFGVTCMTDVINTKISQAKILLTSTELPVNQLAHDLGYNDVYHFIRQFKKCTGYTPGAYRKKNSTI
jgi:AraC family transcriptional regulator of arabinose operon